MTEKDLIKKAGDALDAKLEEAKKTGNLVVKQLSVPHSKKEKAFFVCSPHSYREDLVKQVTD